MQEELEVAQRRACRVLDQPRSTQRYTPRAPDRDRPLVQRMLDLVRRHPRYGYRRITALLRQDGWAVNRKRIHRLWRQEGLKVPQKQRTPQAKRSAQKRRLGHSANGVLRRRAEAVPLLESLHALLVEQKAKLLPKHPLAEAIGYTLNQWRELTLFTTDPAVPIHNNLAEQQMKRIALLRKNALFAGSPRGGETAAILSSLTSTCRRHGIDPQRYLTQLLANLPDAPISRLDDWLPDQWQKRQPAPSVDRSRAES